MKLSLGYNEQVISDIGRIKAKVDYLELYFDLDQYKKIDKNILTKFDSVNLLFNIIEDTPEFLRKHKKTLDQIRLINPDRVTTGSFLFAKYLINNGIETEISIVNKTDTLLKVSQLAELGVSGFSYAPEKAYDFTLFSEVKDFFPQMRTKVIPNMICPACLYYAERHQLFYFSDKNKDLLATDINLDCRYSERILNNSIITPSMVSKYDDLVDIFKISTRRDYPGVLDMVNSFIAGDDEKYLELIFRFWYRDKYSDEMVKVFLEQKQLCDFHCFRCKYNCSEVGNAILASSAIS